MATPAEHARPRSACQTFRQVQETKACGASMALIRRRRTRMFGLTFLGTSASVPSAERNHPGLLIEAGSQRILVDCGEGTQRQLLRGGAGFRRLDRLLLTHGHLDHVLSIPGLFSTLRLRQSTDVMAVHGSPRALEIVVQMLAGLWGEGRAPIPLELIGRHLSYLKRRPHEPRPKSSSEISAR